MNKNYDEVQELVNKLIEIEKGPAKTVIMNTNKEE